MESAAIMNEMTPYTFFIVMVSFVYLSAFVRNLHSFEIILKKVG
jgi:hypothetical protein